MGFIVKTLRQLLLLLLPPLLLLLLLLIIIIMIIMMIITIIMIIGNDAGNWQVLWDFRLGSGGGFRMAATVSCDVHTHARAK